MQYSLGRLLAPFPLYVGIKTRKGCESLVICILIFHTNEAHKACKHLLAKQVHSYDIITREQPQLLSKEPNNSDFC